MEIKTIPKYEKLERITRGQKVIIEDEGAMTFIGGRRVHDKGTGEFWINPVFISELENENYKLIEIFTRSNGIYQMIITPKEENYSQLKNILEGAA